MSLFPMIYSAEKKEYVSHPWGKTIKPIYSNKIRHAHNSIQNPNWVSYRKRKEQTNKIKFTVVGIFTSKEFIYCKNLVKGLHKYRPDVFAAPYVKGLTTIEWPSVSIAMRIKFNDNMFYIQTPVIILANEDFLGGEEELKEFVENKYIYHLCLDYHKEAENHFYTFVKNANAPFVYLHISIDEKPIGSLIFMLYADLVPETCANFIRLCTTKRAGYSGSPIHRIVEDGWIQCGGFRLKDSDLGCENFVVAHDRRGVLGMCNDGRGVACSTQFFVLLGPAEWMKGRFVAFGQLVEGEETLKQIEQVPTYFEAPESSILIYASGVLDMDNIDKTINKRCKFYINKHIDDLVDVGEFYTKLLMQHVWAGIEANEKERREKKKLNVSEETAAEQDESVSSYTSVFEEGENDKENQAPIQAYAALPERKRQKQKEQKQHKPFYLPLTDVPYPGECDSTFDLKKFLRGDYCHELDYDRTADAGDMLAIARKYTLWTSDMYIVEGQNKTEDEYELNSSEEEEIQNYVKSTGDRVSYAGGVIRQMGQVGKDQALINLFEGARKSELPFADDEDFKRRFSVAAAERRMSVKRASMAFNDEDIRRLRRASAFERRASTTKARISMLPGVKAALDRRASRATEAAQSNVHPESAEQMRKIKNLIAINADDGSEDSDQQISFDKKKRQTIFADNLARIQSYQKDIPSDEDEEKKTVSLKLPIGEAETHDKVKRRQTGFMRPEDLKKLKLSQVADDEEEEEEEEEDEEAKKQMYQHRKSTMPPPLKDVVDDDEDGETDPGKEISSGDSSSASLEKDQGDDDPTKPKVKIDPKSKADFRSIQRRPTGFIRPSDIPKDIDDDDDDDEEDGGIVTQGQSEIDPAAIGQHSDFASGRRETEFDPDIHIKGKSTIFAEELARIKSYQKDLGSDDEDSESLENDEEDDLSKPKVKIDPKSKTDFHTIQRRPTGFVRPSDIPKDIDDDEEEEREKPKSEPPRLSTVTETRDAEEYKQTRGKKGRATVFAEALERVKSYIKDTASDESSSDSEKKVAIKLPPGAPETHEKIKRRQTGFMRKEDLQKMKLNLDDEEEDKDAIAASAADSGLEDKEAAAAASSSDPEIHKKGRSTVFAEQLARIKSYQKDIPSSDDDEQKAHKEDDTPRRSSIKSKKATEDEDEDYSLSGRKQSMSEDPKLKVQIHPTTEATQSSIKRRPTGFIRMPEGQPDDDEDEAERGIRESAFLRIYEQAFRDEKDEPLPTLKNYRPLAEKLGSRILKKTLLLPSEAAQKLRAARSSSNELFGGHMHGYGLRTKSDSFEIITNIKYGKEDSIHMPKILSTEYVHTLQKAETPQASPSIRRLEYSTKRPRITVEEYRKINEERMEKFKREGKIKVLQTPASKSAGSTASSQPRAPKPSRRTSSSSTMGGVQYSFNVKPMPMLDRRRESRYLPPK